MDLAFGELLSDLGEVAFGFELPGYAFRGEVFEGEINNVLDQRRPIFVNLKFRAHPRLVVGVIPLVWHFHYAVAQRGLAPWVKPPLGGLPHATLEVGRDHWPLGKTPCVLVLLYSCRGRNLRWPNITGTISLTPVRTRVDLRYR